MRSAALPHFCCKQLYPCLLWFLYLSFLLMNTVCMPKVCGGQVDEKHVWNLLDLLICYLKFFGERSGLIRNSPSLLYLNKPTLPGSLRDCYPVYILFSSHSPTSWMVVTLLLMALSLFGLPQCGKRAVCVRQQTFLRLYFWGREGVEQSFSNNLYFLESSEFEFWKIQLFCKYRGLPPIIIFINTSLGIVSVEIWLPGRGQRQGWRSIESKLGRI